MFYYIKGKLVHLEPSCAVIDAGGVGYKLTISYSTFESLPHGNTEAPVLLYTYFAVREDGVELFGFFSEQELSTYKLLISVSGVGPKAAMSILSLLTPEKFAIAVCTEDAKAISKAQGIGAKTAARIILELKDKLSADVTEKDIASNFVQNTRTPVGGKMSEAQDALLVLGYSRSEALNVLKNIDVSNLSLEEIIRIALKKLIK